ncbi:hypothetical protein AMIS_2740 [Actinoplanes missouriensis 431]|uniref:Uncharacterized protein n=1 Tax=Actinoplanes missouriensis (strain ATCC 14538 / DSM 43046 / CBS 188.64 / JCM 3121 / NBRC 102363 / NCIMB 12654 / NRRL B-3342 / UNCC 431) TaxID=512565 RepID=I0GXK7_ACTM4|nr:hypothetical protein [Actinoplanes missouriensis]KOX45241.1 hypothetical protein ADL19_23225 [Streptomyces purpurogeneiscleroticus]BAL85494.1 hypothetical protein AMIS_2740 [Actinoplanes missouriensis 431]
MIRADVLAAIILTALLVAIAISVLMVLAYEYRRRWTITNRRLDRVLREQREIAELREWYAAPAVTPEHERGDS